MARRNSTRTSPSPASVEKIVEEQEKKEVSSPVSLETQTSEEPVAAPPAAEPEKIRTDFREKLARKTDNQDIFIPSNPASLEKAAKQVAEESGFELNRGTSVGARLIARARKMA